METHALGHVRWHPRRANGATTTILQVGALAGVAAGLMYAAWQVVVAAIAQHPTAVPGIHQTLWTPPQAIWSVVFGVHHFHGSFHFIPVVGGVVAHMGNSLILGILGVALLIAILGRRPNPAAAIVLGAAYGIAVDAIVINGIVNTQKDPDALQRDAALELVGRSRDLRHHARLAQQRPAEKEQRQARRGVTACGLTTATPFPRTRPSRAMCSSAPTAAGS